MAYGFFRPTMYKFMLFILISLVLLYAPIVPTVQTAVVSPEHLGDASKLVMSSPIANIQSMEIIGMSSKSFGIFAGTEAGVLNILYMLMIGYLLACVFLYGFHKIHG